MCVSAYICVAEEGLIDEPSRIYNVMDFRAHHILSMSYFMI